MWKHASLILALAACGAFPRPPDLVACTPGQFAQCRGDTELICNTAGTDYDAVSCGRGCEPTIGCRLCDANQTVCTNGKVQRCDATGTVTSSEACPLGCFEDQPRCREIDPSNNLASYMDMAATAPDLDLSMGGGIVADTGIVATSKGTRISTPSFVIPAPPGGSPIRVFLANHVQLGGVVEVVVSHLGTGPALAIVAHDRILVNGTLVFSIDSRGGFSAGGVTFPECIGGQSALWHVADGPTYYSGTGGGGHATMGGKGGDMIGVLRDPMPGGAGGKASGNPTLVPLRGGCGSGSEAPSPAIGSSGGGALQLSSRIEITVAASSVLNLNGGRGLAGPDIGGPSAVNGGGAGGGILLEAPTVKLLDSSRLLVNGGGGASWGDVKETSLTTAVTPGGDGNLPYYSQGGNGAASDGPATSGADFEAGPTTGSQFNAGAGGGGLGYIRINTATGSYTMANNVIQSGVVTTGVIGTR